ncbi:MAG: crotonase/enoyl-CoA hydratase family protein [Desulfobacterales bacterium]
MQPPGPFSLEKTAGIAWLTLNRPEKHNAMDADFFEFLRQHFRQLDDDGDVKVVVIKAAGESFSAGTDLASAAKMVGGGAADERQKLHRKILDLQAAVSAVEQCCKPVIAAIHGYCIGGAVDLICACDIRIAESAALFSIREARMGIIADLGTLQRLPRIVGEGRARELAFSGRDFSATEACAMGLVSRVCEGRQSLHDAAETLARQIADNPPLTVMGVKDVFNYSRDHGVEAGLRYVAQKNAALLLSEDLAEAFSAFREKRKPQFKGK